MTEHDLKILYSALAQYNPDGTNHTPEDIARLQAHLKAQIMQHYNPIHIVHIG